MCICLNCNFIYNCDVYQMIEEKHKQVKLKKKKNFIPYSPLILVNITKIKNENEIEWDVIDCLSYEEFLGAWMHKMS